MAQITISEEHYQELLILAQARGMTPDALADTLLEQQLIATDQHILGGEDIDVRIEASLQELAQRPSRNQTNEEFLAEIKARMKGRNP